MGSEWKEYKLGQVTKWSSGGTPPKNDEKYWNGDIPWISASSMNGKRYNDSKLKLTKEGLRKGSRLATKDSLLLLVRGSILHQKIQVGITEKDVAFNQDVKSLLANEDIVDPWFLLFWFMSKEPELLGMVENTGIGAGKLDTKLMQDLSIKIPPNRERKAIVGLFKAIEDKIELNRQMNQTLEQMEQALFKTWFVDFDPVIDNALAAGNAIPEPLQKRAAQRKALGDKRKPLPDNIQQFFPAEFEFSEELDKWVPKGWKAGTISEVADVIGGGTPSTKVEEYFCEDGIAWLSPKDLSGYEWKFISRGAKDITELGLSNSSAKLMPKGAILFSSRAPIGYVAIGENEISTNQGFKSLVPKAGMCSEYLYYFLKSNVENIEAIATGSTFKEVSGNAIKTFNILIPSVNILTEYRKVSDDNNNKRLLIQKEVPSLTKLRDTLLPKLVSGEVRVPEEQL
ncbi:MAG TPA: restriction endonuclease subunit S [Draconibacterium sp.]|nr:restriction endonuclease subunit S [Draconibacterium sp.]